MPMVKIMLIYTNKSYCMNLEDLLKYLLSPKIAVTLTNFQMLNILNFGNLDDYLQFSAYL